MNTKLAMESVVFWRLASVLVSGCLVTTGCVKFAHEVRYSVLGQTVQHSEDPYYHSPQTGRIVVRPKKADKYCYGEPPFYGFEATCWQRWPDGWVGCPCQEEIIITPAQDVPESLPVTPAEPPHRPVPAPPSANPVEATPPPAEVQPSPSDRGHLPYPVPYAQVESHPSMATSATPVPPAGPGRIPQRPEPGRVSSVQEVLPPRAPVAETSIHATAPQQDVAAPLVMAEQNSLQPPVASPQVAARPMVAAKQVIAESMVPAQQDAASPSIAQPPVATSAPVAAAPLSRAPLASPGSQLDVRHDRDLPSGGDRPLVSVPDTHRRASRRHIPALAPPPQQLAATPPAIAESNKGSAEPNPAISEPDAALVKSDAGTVESEAGMVEPQVAASEPAETNPASPAPVDMNPTPPDAPTTGSVDAVVTLPAHDSQPEPSESPLELSQASARPAAEPNSPDLQPTEEPAEVVVSTPASTNEPLAAEPLPASNRVWLERHPQTVSLPTEPSDRTAPSDEALTVRDEAEVVGGASIQVVAGGPSSSSLRPAQGAQRPLVRLGSPSDSLSAVEVRFVNTETDSPRQRWVPDAERQEAAALAFRPTATSTSGRTWPAIEMAADQPRTQARTQPR